MEALATGGGGAESTSGFSKTTSSDAILVGLEGRLLTRLLAVLLARLLRLLGLASDLRRCSMSLSTGLKTPTE